MENGALHACPNNLFKGTAGADLHCGDDVAIGDGSQIGQKVRIRFQTVLGKVTIGDFATIGSNVVGGDGYIGKASCIDAKVVLVPGDNIADRTCVYRTDDAGNYVKIAAQPGNRCYWHETEKKCWECKQG